MDGCVPRADFVSDLRKLSQRRSFSKENGAEGREKKRSGGRTTGKRGGGGVLARGIRVGLPPAARGHD